MELEENQASPELMKFFEGLLNLKKMVKDELETSNDPFTVKIYEQLESLIQEKKS